MNRLHVRTAALLVGLAASALRRATDGYFVELNQLRGAAAGTESR